MAQAKLPPVPKVEDPEKYIESVFGNSKDPNVPTFFEFMEKERGMPMSYFSKESLQTLALIMETTFYSQYANMAVEMSRAAQNQQEEGKRADDWASDVSIEEINGAVAAMEQRLEQLKAAREAKVGV